MDTLAFQREIEKLKFRSINQSDILAVAEKAYSNNEVRKLYSESERTLDEYVKLLSECTPIGEVTNAKIIDFLLANKLLKEAIKGNVDLIESYGSEIKEERALPALAIEEIATIIAMAFLTGTFSSIAKTIFTKLLKKKDLSKKDLKKALQLLLSNSILPSLEEHKDGLTAEELAKILSMESQDVGYFLAKYETQGWIESEVKNKKEVWKIKKNRIEIIEEFVNKSRD